MSGAAGMRLAGLLAGLCSVPDADDRPVGGLCLDSRECRPGDLFIALRGQRVHGLDHVDEVRRAGAVALLFDPAEGQPPAAPGLPCHAVPDLREAAGTVADRFFSGPSRAMAVIGVTGTNGKSSVSHFAARALDRPGARCAVGGTLGCGLPEALEPSRYTTPDVIGMHRMLASFRDAGAARAVLEVSSHALDQARVAGVVFDTAVFTNLSHDHLDYHGDSDSYGAAKRRLFAAVGLRHAVLNLDDPVGRSWAGDLRERVAVHGYGFTPAAEVRGRDLVLGPDGLAFSVVTPQGEGRLQSRLLGRFNASNLLAALAVLLLYDVSFADAISALEALDGVPGRMERFAAPGRPQVVVDYAHTPDALEGALKSLRAHCRGRLWCVFGCGGERDRFKRPIMGALAEQLADRVIVTDDNPRHEDGDEIVAEIVAGMHMPGTTTVIRDRGAALAEALAAASPEDLVLVAGKGHETRRQVAGRSEPWSDRDAVRALLEAAS